MRMITIVLAAAALCGCVSSGRPIDHARADAFVPGRTTYSEVVTALGPPNGIMTSNGLRTVTYTHMTVRTNPATFIPVVGLFAGGSDVNTDTMAFSFDENNVLKTGGTSLRGGSASSMGR
jgi:hypothetical protein